MNSAFSTKRTLWPETVHGRWMDSDYKSGLVSVIIPAYNREELISETLKSVQAQTYRPIELIVVDDGSLDNTVDVLKDWKAEYESSDLAVRVIEQENQGAPVARNRGLIESTGEFIQYLDSDDLLHPQKIEIHTYSLCNSTDYKYVWSEPNRFHDESELTWNEYDSTAIAGIAQMKQMVVFNIPHTCWSGMYTRDLCYHTGPWNESLHRWQDLEYNIRVSHQSGVVVKVPFKLYGWRQHNKGRIGDMGKRSEGVRHALHTLSEVEKLLNQSNMVVQEPIVRPYMAALDESMLYNDLTSAYTVLNGLQKQIGPTATFYWARGLIAIASIIGGQNAIQLKKLYSTLRIFLSRLSR